MKNTFLFLCATLFYFSCVNNRVDPTCSAPDTVSFKSNILPIFRNNCSTSGCHSGSFPAGNLNLEDSLAYTQLNRISRGYVDTINPKNSVLYGSLVSVSNPMPPKGNLDTCTINLVLKWMAQKAKNN
jgi:hypothetical protein